MARSLEDILQQQIGSLVFQLAAARAQIEALQEELTRRPAVPVEPAP